MVHVVGYDGKGVRDSSISILFIVIITFPFWAMLCGGCWGSVEPW